MRRLLLCTTTLLLVLAGCASGPSAQDWAAAVCGALAPWRATITDLNRRAADQMAQATTTEETRQNLIALVTDAREATESARAAIVAAGVPDVEGGAAVADGFAASLARTRDAYGAAATELRALPSSDETAFYDGVVEVLGRLNQRYEASGTELTRLESPPLTEAFDRLAECQ